MLLPDQMSEFAEKTAVKKISLNSNLTKILLLSILAGIYISFGGIFATVISSGASEFLPVGLTKVLMGIAFSLGLILVVIGGAELFTGNTIVSLGITNKSIKPLELLKNWSLVYIGNFIGSLLTVALIFWSKHYTFGGGTFGVTSLKISISKVSLDPVQAFTLGILANALVCLAIWLSFSAKTTVGKIVAMVPPVALFVASGFEHSVANMYLITVGLVIKTFDPVFTNNLNLTHIENLNLFNFLIMNLIPVTLGNIVGGIFVWLIYQKIYKPK